MDWFGAGLASWLLFGGLAFFLLLHFRILRFKKRDMLKGLSLFVAALGFVAILGFINLGAGEQLALAGDAGVEGEVELAVNCPDTLQTTVYARLEDSLASTLTYIGSSDVYFVTDGETSNFTTDSGGYSNSVTLTCGRPYDVYVPVQRGTAGSAKALGFMPEGQSDYLHLESHQISDIQFRIKDIAEDAYESIFNHGATSGTNATTYTRMNASNIFESSAADDLDVGADGYLDMKILLKTQTTNKLGGDKPYRYWLLVDTGTDNEWQEPVVSFDGVKLVNQKSDIDADSQTGSLVSAAEYAYVLGKGDAIDDIEHTLNFYIKARSGQNPDTSNDDIKLTIVSEGLYKSSLEPDTFKVGIYNDASTQTLVVPPSAYDPYLVINIK